MMTLGVFQTEGQKKKMDISVPYYVYFVFRGKEVLYK